MERKKILIVDDEQDIREPTRRYLERNGYEAIAVESALLGLKLLRKENFDALVSDINMPQMDGLEFVKRAKDLRPNLAILLLTGYGSLETAQQAIKIGVHDYLTKPVELEKLKDSIDEGINRAAERDDLGYYQRLEAELRANKEKLDSMKNELITLISHELRTPVTVITSAFDLLKPAMELPSSEKMQMLTDEQKRRLFDNIERGHRRLITIIEDLSYYLSLVKQETKLAKETVDLNNFLSSNFEALRHLIDEYNVVLRLELAEEIIKAEICREKILDVLERLIHNAASHNPEGTKITLRLSSGKEEGDNKEARFARLEICDNGKGIERHLLQHIFSPFSASDINHHGKGLGMGLSICKKVVDLHAGDISLDSQEGKGTKVTIEFPASG